MHVSILGSCAHGEKGLLNSIDGVLVKFAEGRESKVALWAGPDGLIHCLAVVASTADQVVRTNVLTTSALPVP